MRTIRIVQKKECKRAALAISLFVLGLLSPVLDYSTHLQASNSLFSEGSSSCWLDVSNEFTSSQDRGSNTPTGPAVRISPPRPVIFTKDGITDRLLIRIVQDTLQLNQKILSAEIKEFPQVVLIPGRYPDEPGAYLSLSESDSFDQLPKISDPACSIEKRVQTLKACIDAKEIAMPSFDRAPMLITDDAEPAANSQTLLLLSPWNFKRATRAAYTKLIFENMLQELYFGFRAYKQLMQQKCPQIKVVVNTGPWGVSTMRNNPFVVAILQILAGSIAGIDELRFYYGQKSRYFKFAVEKAEQFIKAQVGKQVDEALSALQQLVQEDSLFTPQASSNGVKAARVFTRPKEVKALPNRS